jgi:hypothetical protein
VEGVLSEAYKAWSAANAPPRPGGINADVVARAEAALKALSGQFASWLQDEVDKLDAAGRRVAAEGLSGEAGDTFYIHAHDLKGLGGTYEFPIVTRLAGSLCRLLDGGRAEAPLDLAFAHVDAIKSVVRDGIREESHPQGAGVLRSLEDRVRATTDFSPSAR